MTNIQKLRPSAPSRSRVFGASSIGLLCGLAVGAFAAHTGCTASQCQGSGGDPDRPSSAVECGAGYLCYRGSCVGACNAGAEKVQACESSSDCSDPVRSTCVDRYCSACEEGEVCVPRLNICERVRSVSIDSGPRDAGPPLALDPLDGGRIDGSVFGITDTGGDGPSSVPYSHFGTITISRIEDMISAAAGTDITAEILDIRTASVSPEVVELNDSDRNQYVDCEIATLLQVRPKRGFSIGDIFVHGDLRGMPPAGYKLAFDGTGYRVAPAPPGDLLVYTVIGDENTLRVLGSGNPSEGFNPYPSINDPTHLIPYEMVLPGDMSNKLRTGFVIANPANDALQFSWQQPFPCPAGAPDQCHGRGQNIVVRVTSPTHEMRCVGPEISPIRLTEPFLDRFRAASGLAPGTALPLTFERRYFSKMAMSTNLEAGIRIDMKVIITHAYQSRVLFQ
ncbi:MAG: hypothetical protein HYV07_22135 [Deltaproteobacteria bacterium]|nr:hypothetical protein [Deltaproteobacteria bacterium]